MNLSALIEENESIRAKYDYYRSLGYTDYAAAVFSTVTYGDDDLVSLVQKLTPDKTRTISDLAAWLKERPETWPEKAFFNYARENRIQSLMENREFFAKFKGGPSSRASAKATSAAKKSVGAGITPTPPVEACFAPAAPVEACFAPAAPYESEESSIGFVAPDESYAAPVLNMRIDSSVKSRRSSRSPLRTLAEALSTDSYEPIEEKSAKNVFTSPTSTFRMTTSNASMGIIFNQLRNGRWVNMNQVRIEEVLNYFDYDAKAPENEKFRISTELLPKGDSKKLLYIHAQAAEEARDHQNIVLLLDVSGSMSSKTKVTQEAIAAIFSKLKTGDKISLVTYSSEDETVLDGYEIRSEQDKETLMGILFGIRIYGGTYGSAGIETAYEIGAKHYHPDWNNQVILITDGDLNFGITSKNGLEKLIEKKKKSNLFLSVIGTGLYNLMDDKLQVLSKHGNGTYCVVNTLSDVEESINRHYIALTNIIAKDVKAQVEFNPRFVKSYRLLGFENRQLNHEDFTNDAVISEPYGSGSHGVALYELEMATENSTPASDLKYQTPVLTDSDELGTVKIRYKDPLSDVSHPVEATFFNKDYSTSNARLAYLLYCISEKLRGSDKLDEADEAYLADMLTDRKYKDIAGPNLEKLDLLIDALNPTSEWEYSDDFDLTF